MAHLYLLQQLDSAWKSWALRSLLGILVFLGVSSFARAQQLQSDPLLQPNWANGSKQLTISTSSCATIADAHLQVILDDGESHLKGSTFSTQLTVTVSYSTGQATETKTLSIQQLQPETRVSLTPLALASSQQLTATLTVVSGTVTQSGSAAVQAKQRLRLVATPTIAVQVTGLTCTVPTTTTTSTSANFDQTLSWASTCNSVTNYQIRILYRPDIFGNAYIPTHTPEDFEREALLIETGSGQLFYKLALAQGAGDYYWQVRPLGNAPGGAANPKNWGDWSSPSTFTVTRALLPEASHSWIYSRTFTEGGRVAEKLTFANGLQQVRQTQTRLAVMGQPHLLATQVLQDYSGRDAVTSLPIPLSDNYLHYVPKLLATGSPNSNAYGPAQFDADAIAAQPASGNLPPVAAQPATYNQPLPAGQPGEDTENHYYSGLDNPMNIDGRVPDAGGYPFTRTRFTNDGTNRVAEQSGVGAVMKIQPTGTTMGDFPRTVRTYYMGVAPEELYRIFGKESPDPKGVHKILTLDPNNTPSVTYQTKEGQTIATALSVISALDTARVRHLASANSSFRVNESISGRSSVISKTITITSQDPQVIDIDYSTVPAELDNACINYCSTCDYTVKIRVIKLEPGAPTLIVNDSIFVINSASCSTAAPAPHTYHPSLSAGTYRIEREIIPYKIPVTGSTAPTNGRTLADHLAIIRAGLDLTLSATPWDYINGYLNNENIEGLYALLQAQGYAITNVNGVDYYEVPSAYSSTSPAYCTATIKLPILTGYCGDVCDINDVIGSAFTKLDSELNRLNSQYSAGIQATDIIDPSILADLLAHMKGSGYYTCEQIRDCFDAEVASLEMNMYMSNVMPVGYSYNFLKGFLQCAGVHIDNVRVAPAVADIAYAYEQLQIDPDNKQHVQCIMAGILNLNPGADLSAFSPANNPPPNSSTPYTPANPSPLGTSIRNGIDGYLASLNYLSTDDRQKALNSLYQCINSNVPYSPVQNDNANVAQDAANDLTQKCRQACEDRRGEFQEAITARLHLRGIVVEGDVYRYSPTDFSPGNIHPVLTTVLVKQDDEFVESCQIQMLVQELVNNCGKYCEVTVHDLGDGKVSVGDFGELTKVKIAMTHGFDLDVQDLTHGALDCDQTNRVEKIQGNILENAALTPGAAAVMSSVAKLASSVNRLLNQPSGIRLPACPPLGGISEALKGHYFNVAQVDENSWPVQDPACPAGSLPAGGTYAVTVVDNRDVNSSQWWWADFNFATDFLLNWQSHAYNNTNGCTFLPNTYGWDGCGSELYAETDHEKTPPYYRIRFMNKEKGMTYAKSDIREISPPFLRYPLNLPIPVNSPPAPSYALTSQDVKVRIRLYDPVDKTERWVTADIDAQGYQEGVATVPVLLNHLKWKDVTHCEVRNNERYAMCFTWHAELDTITIPDGPSSVYSGPEDCKAAAVRTIRNAFEAEKDAWRQAQLDAFTDDYNNKCLALAGLVENFSFGYSLGYYHYTLYYYDRAGNLVRTVPPAGVVPLTAADLVPMLPTPPPAGSPPGTPPGPPAQTRDQWPLPTHSLVTTYTYNSLHQLVQQNTPDGGVTRFFYNAKGQLRFSQNAEQALHKMYSYTRYDELGRVTEVGENPFDPRNSNTTLTLDKIVAHVQDMAYPEAGYAHDMTRTVYSVARLGLNYPGTAAYPTTPQRNLLNRVSYSWTDSDGDPATTLDNVYTYYSYDPHGNVEWLCQQQQGLGRKYVRYDYDLLSNKVLRVQYQEGQADQFYHRYGYDADNRLTEVYTSADGEIWDQDARYQYYAHGPLQRLELGEDRVQGLDYTYTIQGWLKAINHPVTDPGNDGATATASAADAFSMTLGYHAGDYVSEFWEPTAVQQGSLPPTNSLYNGNIGSWTSKTRTEWLAGASGSPEPIVGEQYRYDDLNRLVASQTATNGFVTGTGFTGFTATQNFKTLYAYDANGNLTGLRRQGNTGIGAPADMDRLTYAYYPGTNKLRRIDDAVPGNALYQDVKPVTTVPTSAALFSYNAIGNLTQDQVGGASSIRWNVYGKIASVSKTDGGATSYRYDAAGNRVRKLVRAGTGSSTPGGGGAKAAPAPGPASPGVAQAVDGTGPGPGDPGTGEPWPEETGTAVYYVRDAPGNVLAVYEKELTGPSTASTAPALVEQPLYGSSRLGERVTRGVALALPTGGVYRRAVGQKRYELADHLGNVRAVVSDEPLDNPVGGVGGRKPELLAYYNYYPFGLEQPGRTNPGNGTLAGGYRFGFNGKEKDNNGELGLTNYDYGARVYNPAYGKWLSLDPEAQHYPSLSPYHAFANNPVIYVDEEGKSNIIYLIVANDANGKPTLSQGKAVAAVAKANDYFSKMGLNTQVVLFDESKRGTFNVSNMDKTDNVAVIGNSPEAVVRTIQDRVSPAFAARTIATGEFLGDGDDVPEVTNLRNPEATNSSGNRIGIAIRADKINAFRKEAALKKVVQIYASENEATALIILHAAGHNTLEMNAFVPYSKDYGHTNNGVMADGNTLKSQMAAGGVANVISLQQPDNMKYAEAMRSRYGTAPAQDNYDRNKRGKRPRKAAYEKK